MKLDPRIEKDTLIYTPFSMKGTNEMIALHDMGYFTDDMSDFSNLRFCAYGELVNVSPDGDSPYACIRDDKPVKWYQFYIPEGNLKPVEKKKKYRPFTDTKEFFIKTNFEQGDVLYVRSKSDNTEHHLMLIGWTDDKVLLGDLYRLTFKVLFDKFELWDGEDNFIPFGAEETE